MNNWKMIEGYKYPYRINEDAVVEELQDNGEWQTVRPFTKQDGRRAPRLCVTMVNKANRPALVPVKRLMVNAFLGGSHEGVSYGYKNGFHGDCSLRNLYRYDADDYREQRKAYRKYMENKEAMK